MTLTAPIHRCTHIAFCILFQGIHGSLTVYILRVDGATVKNQLPKINIITTEIVKPIFIFIKEFFLEYSPYHASLQPTLMGDVWHTYLSFFLIFLYFLSFLVFSSCFLTMFPGLFSFFYFQSELLSEPLGYKAPIWKDFYSELRIW